MTDKQVSELTAAGALSGAELFHLVQSGTSKKVTLQTIIDYLAYQPFDADLTAIAGLSPSNDDVLQRKSGAWANRTLAQLKADLALADTALFVIDGMGSTITTGLKGDLVIPFACTITAWTLVADQSGSIVVDIWKDTYANYPPVIGDVITASAKPTISTATKGQSSTLTGWTTSIAAGDVLRFNVNSVTTIQRVTIALQLVRT